MPPSSVQTWECPGTVVSVHDGDTLICDIDLGYHVTIRSAVRILGSAAPELGTRSKPNAAGIAARDYAKAIAPAGTKVKVVSHKLLGTFEKYGRVLAALTLPSGQDFAGVMVAAGHAVPWDGTGVQPG